MRKKVVVDLIVKFINGQATKEVILNPVGKENVIVLSGRNFKSATDEAFNKKHGLQPLHHGCSAGI